MLARTTGAFAVCAALLALPPSALAQPAADVDPKVALPILMKVLTYDRNFGSRVVGDFVVLVASEEGKGSGEELAELARSLKLTSVSDHPLKFVAGTFKDQASLDAAIQSSHAKAVLAAPGMSAKGVTDLSEVAQDNQIYTLALEVASVEKALALGIANQNGRPQIVINLAASRGIGAVFDTAVLKLARVIQ